MYSQVILSMPEYLSGCFITTVGVLPHTACAYNWALSPDLLLVFPHVDAHPQEAPNCEGQNLEGDVGGPFT